MACTFTWLETDGRNLEESACKYYKRLLVGIIRWYEVDGTKLSVPDDFFYEIGDDDGFDINIEELESAESGIPLMHRTFQTTKDWKINEDDCGHEDLGELSFETKKVVERKTDRVHLKLVVDND